MSRVKTEPSTPPAESLSPGLSPGRRTAAILLLIFVLGMVLRFRHLDDVALRAPDEHVYAGYAKRIADGGMATFPMLIREYNQDPAQTMFPPPMRIGYLSLLSTFMQLTGTTDERAGAWLACFASLASLAVVGILGARFLPSWAAIYGMLYLALSISDLAIARRCWQDSVVSLLGLLMVWAACEIRRNPGKVWAYALLVVIGSYSVLVKEPMAFVYGGCVIYVLLLLYQQRAWRTITGLLLGGLAGAAVSFLCLVSAAGGMTPLLTSWHALTAATRINPYGIEYQNGPTYRWIWGFWILSPVNLLLWFFAVAIAWLPKARYARLSLPLNSEELSLLRLFAGVTMLLLAASLAWPNSQNFRYMAPIYGPMFLLGGMGLWALWHVASRSLQGLEREALGVLLAAAVIGNALMSYQDFQRVFVKEAVPDLSIKMVLDSRR